MRESKKTERMHLPRGSTEAWLESQTPTPSEAKHKNPPKDTYEVWIGKRVGKSRRSKKSSLKVSV